MSLKVGFTGSREGMTQKQKEAFIDFISKHTITEFHHGDCMGADAQAHQMVHAKIPTISHPPTDQKLRAFTENAVTKAPKEYLVRNHDIVDESDVLIATPKTATEELRSGTWATIRYAQKQDKCIIILAP